MYNNNQVSIDRASQLLYQSKKLFVEVFKHGSLKVEFYKPDKIDKQTPHDRDEIYVVASGNGVFINNGKKYYFRPGDFLFVTAKVEHYFENFSDDFSTWVFFYGPEGGEVNLAD